MCREEDCGSLCKVLGLDRKTYSHLPKKIVESKWADAIIAAFRSSKLSFEFRGEVAERLKAAVC